MAMKELEAMYDAIDGLNERSIERNGRPHPYAQRLFNGIEIQVEVLKGSFDKGIEAGRKLSEAVRELSAGKINIQEFDVLQEECCKDALKAEYVSNEAMAQLNDFADLLNVPQPQGKHKDGRHFARELMGEYDAYSHAYARALAKSVQHGIPFKISEHAPQSEKVMRIANESAGRIREAMNENSLPRDYMSDIPEYEFIGSREFLVRNSLGNIPQDLDKEDVRAAVRVSRHDNGKTDTIFVPATYIPDRNVYIINEKDYQEKIAEVGVPFAAIDIKVPDKVYDPDNPGEGGERDVFARAESIMRKHGYSGKEQDDNRRHNLLKTLLDNKVLTRAEMDQYFRFRNNMAKNNPVFNDQRENLLNDAKFVENYTPVFERDTKMKDAEVIARK